MITKNKTTDRKRKIALITAAAGVVLMLIGTVGLNSRSDKNESVEMTYYTEKLEERISLLLCSVVGIHDAKVMLTLDGGSEYIYAQNEQMSAKDYVIVTEGKDDKTVLVNEIFPKVRGVAVACTGGDKKDVQAKVTELLSAALGIGTNRIKVVGYGE